MVGYPGAFDAVGTTEQLTHLRDEVLPAHWLAASATGSAEQCAARVGRPVRRRRRQRHPARGDPGRAGSRRRGLGPDPAARALRRPAGQPGLDGAAVSADVVCDPAGLTSEWVSAALGREVSVVSVAPVGTGQIGACYRVALEDGVLLAKLPAADPGMREMLAGVYRSEVTFYAELADTVAVTVPALRPRRHAARHRRVHAAARGPGPGGAGRPGRGVLGGRGEGGRGQPGRAARAALVRPDAHRGRGAEP